MQEFWEVVRLLDRSLQKEIFNKIWMLDRTLYPYADGLKAKLDPYIQGLEPQLTAL
uniref:Uncharacterized protein n=1 Tax=Anguilla anguilla TaxID=7936 RepID=A0A0E9RY22_ANGAN